jgi:hypothetical protein
MDELVQLVAEKAGYSKSQALKAVDTVMDFLDDKLPEPLDSQVKQALDGGQVTDVVDDVTKGLGGMLGKKD